MSGSEPNWEGSDSWEGWGTGVPSRLPACAQSLGLRGRLELLPRSARTNDSPEVKADCRGDPVVRGSKGRTAIRC